MTRYRDRFGPCPVCGGDPVSVERRLDGNAICGKRHRWPALPMMRSEERAALVERIEAVERERDELRREVERLRRIEAAAAEIVRYEDEGPLGHPDWDAKHEALREALGDESRAVCEAATIGHISATSDAQERERRLRDLVRELCSELESELRERWQPDSHPSSKARFDRDMVTVREAREALGDE